MAISSAAARAGLLPFAPVAGLRSVGRASGMRAGDPLTARRGAARADASAAGSADPGTPTEAFVRGQDFIRRCIAGEPSTRDEFVREYGALVRYAVAAVLRARNASLLADELEDLTQTVLLSFFDRDCRRLKMYQGRNQASFATFVRVCATRQTLDYLRSRRRKPPIAAEQEREEDSSALAAAVDPAAGPEEQAAIAQGIAQLGRAVAALSPREQLLVRLHFVLGCDIAEVARALNVTANAVHVLKSRVKSKLRTLVDLGDSDDA
jgi:RNA polymerase sigma factor (sigma-70 family)